MDNLIKKYTITAALAFAVSPIFAQEVWEKPVDNSTKTQTQEKEIQAQKKAETASKDAKYLEGAVTEKDGKVVWTTEMKFPGKTAQEIYDAALEVMQSLTKADNQLDGSAVALVNKKDHIIATTPREWLTFTSKFLWLDRAEMHYTLITTCTDGQLSLSMERIKYVYADNGKDNKKISAEESINDENALNKKKTKLVLGWAKFRRKTVDRKDEIFKYVEDGVRAKLK